MSTRITITVGQLSCLAELNDSDCAGRICQALPIRARTTTWGQEVYFDIPLACPEADDARQDVQVGELGYWPAGKAFCIFFGPTPASGPDGQPRAAGKVNPIGRVVGDAAVFQAVEDGQEVVLAAAT